MGRIRQSPSISEEISCLPSVNLFLRIQVPQRTVQLALAISGCHSETGLCIRQEYTGERGVSPTIACWAHYIHEGVAPPETELTYLSQRRACAPRKCAAVIMASDDLALVYFLLHGPPRPTTSGARRRKTALAWRGSELCGQRRYRFLRGVVRSPNSSRRKSKNRVGKNRDFGRGNCSASVSTWYPAEANAQR